MEPWPEQQHIFRFGIMEYVFQWLVWIPLDSCCWFQTSSWHPGSVKVCTLIFVCLCNVYLGNRLCQWSIATRLGGTPHWLLCLNVAAGWIGMMGNRDWAVTCLSCVTTVFFFFNCELIETSLCVVTSELLHDCCSGIGLFDVYVLLATFYLLSR